MLLWCRKSTEGATCAILYAAADAQAACRGVRGAQVAQEHAAALLPVHEEREDRHC